MKRAIKRFLIFCFNLLTPKHKNRIYVRGRLPFPKGRQDILNNGASNMYRFLEAFLSSSHSEKVFIYLEYSDPERLALYEDFLKRVSSQNVVVRFCKCNGMEQSKQKAIHNRVANAFRLFSSTVWLCETGDTFPYGNLACQKIVCMNYFISCKNDFIPGQETRWAHLHALVTTSEMASQVVAKDTGVKVDHCYELGFPRNDLLLHSEKTEAVRSWLVSKLGYMPKHIFLYAPTFRDYELDDKAFAKLFSSDPSWVDQMTFGDCRPLLGYEAEGLSEFLHQTRSVFIYHLHPMQKTAIIEKSDCMLAYEESYDYSLYDLMALSDCLITDYSSIGYDFLLRDRPLIYNLYDLELYARLRGLSYDPYEEYCAGHIVTNWQEMKKAMEDVVNGVDDYREKRDRVRSLMFKDPDGNATQRVVEWFDREIISH